MIAPRPVTLEGYGMRLEPLALEHHDALVAAAADGRLWELWHTSVLNCSLARPIDTEGRVVSPSSLG